MSRHMAWTPEQIELAQRMKKSGYDYGEIAARIGRSRKSVGGLFWRMAGGRKPKRTPQELRKIREVAGKDVPPPEVLAERDRRITAPVTLSAAMLGDPPIGYSALDRRQQS